MATSWLDRGRLGVAYDERIALPAEVALELGLRETARASSGRCRPTSASGGRARSADRRSGRPSDPCCRTDRRSARAAHRTVRDEADAIVPAERPDREFDGLEVFRTSMAIGIAARASPVTRPYSARERADSSSIGVAEAVDLVPGTIDFETCI